MVISHSYLTHVTVCFISSVMFKQCVYCVLINDRKETQIVCFFMFVIGLDVMSSAETDDKSVVDSASGQCPDVHKYDLNITVQVHNLE